MKFNKEQKKQEVRRLTEQIKQAKVVIILGYQGTKVVDLTELRKKLREKKIDIKVIKNSLLMRAMKTLGYELSEEVLKVPLALVASAENEIEPAKLTVEASKKVETLKPLSGVFEGKVVDAAYIQELAKLPSREELFVKLITVIKGPISGLQNVLRYNLAGLINLLKQKNSS